MTKTLKFKRNTSFAELYDICSKLGVTFDKITLDYFDDDTSGGYYAPGGCERDDQSCIIVKYEYNEKHNH